MARPNLLRWWLFGFALWLAELAESAAALRWALWLAGPANGE